MFPNVSVLYGRKAVRPVRFLLILTIYEMNTAKYTDRPERNYPISTETLAFIQNQILLAAQSAQIAGGNYIISGCVHNGNNVSEGVVVIAGEVLPFVGGIAQTNIRIVEEKQSITAGGTTYVDARTIRRVQFGSNLNSIDTYLWADFERLPTNRFLLENSATKAEVEAIKALVMPKGAIIMWSGKITEIPAGFALCDGSTVGGVKTPDLRGRFIVGYYAKRDNEASVNADLFANYGYVGNVGGSKEVALSVAQMPQHDHDLNMLWGGYRHADSGRKFNTIGEIGPSYTNEITKGVTNKTGSGQAHENRPPYYTLAFIIKVV